MVKHVVSVSLGSAQRNHRVKQRLLGQQMLIERIGTDGSLAKAQKILKDLDGKVDALALGGINLTYRVGRCHYPLREGKIVSRVVQHTPLVDGSSFKDVVEPQMIYYLSTNYGWPGPGQKVLLVSALDRWGMAQALEQSGCQLIIGDALFGLKLPLPFYSLKMFQRAAKLTLPLLSQLPIKMLYPLGEKQEHSQPKWQHIFNSANIIAGDFHFMRRYMPPALPGRKIITSTVTASDRVFLKQRGISHLVTYSPTFAGRSFGANVLEAICVALLDKPQPEPEMYLEVLKQLGWKPNVERLN
ncbi:quinate 5-dehydrogenase [Peptococcaceae bacterium 1198_IL3148]